MPLQASLIPTPSGDWIVVCATLFLKTVPLVSDGEPDAFMSYPLAMDTVALRPPGVALTQYPGTFVLISDPFLLLLKPSMGMNPVSYTHLRAHET